MRRFVLHLTVLCGQRRPHGSAQIRSRRLTSDSLQGYFTFKGQAATKDPLAAVARIRCDEALMEHFCSCDPDPREHGDIHMLVEAVLAGKLRQSRVLYSWNSPLRSRIVELGKLADDLEANGSQGAKESAMRLRIEKGRVIRTALLAHEESREIISQGLEQEAASLEEGSAISRRLLGSSGEDQT